MNWKIEVADEQQYDELLQDAADRDGEAILSDVSEWRGILIKINFQHVLDSFNNQRNCRNKARRVDTRIEGQM